MKLAVLMVCALTLATMRADGGGSISMNGVASWYGEAHRGKLMADGGRFDPDRFTAASWFYPLGTRVRVTTASLPRRTIVVTITDRGPSRRLVGRGRLIDLAQAAFKEIADPDLGLVRVTIQPLAE